jgi:hypothetical protein
VKAIVTDGDLLRTVQPADAEAYLQANGWTRAEERRTGTNWVLRGDGGSDTFVFLPRSTDFADYGRRLGELLDTLSEVEQRSELDVLAELSAAGSDIVHVRVVSQITAAGRIPLPMGARVVEGARELLTAAACSAVRPRPVYDFRRETQATRYVADQVLLASAPPSSYAISILSPVPSRLPLREFEPFERQVTRTLLGAMDAVKSAVREAIATNDPSVFASRVDAGVSANLCRALSTMSPGRPDSSLEIGFLWSPMRREPDLVRRAVAITHDEVPMLRAASQILTEIAPREGFEVVGVVRQLDRPPDQEEGTVTLVAVIDDELSTVHTRLRGARYSTAVQAHDAGRTVRLVGALQRRRGRASDYDLLNVSAIATNR